MTKFSFIFLILISCQPNADKQTTESSSNGFQFFDKSSAFVHKDSLYKVIGIGDGDTFDILVRKKKVRIRLDGIDAPERGMPYYKVSKRFLSDLVFSKKVKILVIKTDQYQRLVAKSFVDSVDVSAQMLKSGMAWHYKKYNSSKNYAQYETKAKKQKQGLWQDQKPIAPWEIRKIRRSGQSTKELFE